MPAINNGILNLCYERLTIGISINYRNGGSEQAMKIRLAGSFLLASVFTITAMAFINTFRPAAFCSETSSSVETLVKL